MRIGVVLAVVLISSFAGAYAEDDERVAEPTMELQADAEKLIKDVYKDDYAKRGPEERKTLAAKLLEEGRNTKSDPNSQYVLLREARDLAIQVGDVETAMEAAGEIAKGYKVDVIEMKLKALTSLKTVTRTPEASELAADASLLVIDQATAAENFDAASRGGELAVSFATAAKNMQKVAEAQSRRNEIKAHSTAYLEMKIAQDKLKTNPNDAQSKYVVGTYLCMFKRDWDVGMALAAAGSDPTWAALSKADLANPVDVAEMVRLADQWWDLAQKQPATKFRVFARAEFWYKLSLGNADGLLRARIDKRIEQIEAGRSVTQSVQLSDATRKALPTPAELANLKEICLSLRSGNYNGQGQLISVLQRIQNRLSSDLTSQKENDYLARLKADTQVRRLVEQNGVQVNYSSTLVLQYTSSYLANSKGKEELAARIVMVEKFNNAEKAVDPVALDQVIYSGIRQFASSQGSKLPSSAARLELCSYLKSKGVRSDALERYKATLSRRY